MNSLLGAGLSESAETQLQEVIRSVSVQTADYKLRFDVDSHGQV